MGKIKDITGNRYSRLKVISFYDITNNKARWLCQCDCGKKIITYSTYLVNQNVKSCGCLLHKKKYDKKTKKIIKKLQYVYYHMKQRCYDKNNPTYKHYGGRGIKICEEWLNDINNFHNWAISSGYEENLTIERIDVNGNYEPSNCKWITKTQQGYNKTNSVFYTIKDETKCLSEWCIIYNIDYHVVYKRLKRGKSIEEALKKPIDITKRNKLYKRKD